MTHEDHSSRFDEWWWRDGFATGLVVVSLLVGLTAIEGPRLSEDSRW